MLLVVDDEPMMGNILGTFLEAEGYSNTVFDNPETALEAFRNAEAKPVMLITDQSMPAMTGMDLISGCKAISPQLKTILCSGRVDVDLLASVEATPDRLVSKPFRPADLVESVKALLAA